MLKRQFLKELNQLLLGIEKHERQDILNDYALHIDSAIENGKTEEQAVSDLGSPVSIAQELGVFVTPEKTQSPVKTPPAAKASFHLFAFLGMLLFNLIFIVGPVAGIAGAFVGLYAASLACLLTPLGFVINLFTHDSPIPLAFFFVLAALSFGYLLLVFTNFIGKGFFRVLRWYWNLNVKIVVGGY
jgi:uncharacterized membrane protein